MFMYLHFLVPESLHTKFGQKWPIGFLEKQVLIFIAPANSKVRYRGSTFRPFVQSFVRSSVRPPTIHVKVLYSVAVIAGSMKPCIVITLDTFFKEAP